MNLHTVSSPDTQGYSLTPMCLVAPLQVKIIHFILDNYRKKKPLYVLPTAVTLKEQNKILL